jgi:hypothetical protein
VQHRFADELAIDKPAGDRKARWLFTQFSGR